MTAEETNKFMRDMEASRIDPVSSLLSDLSWWSDPKGRPAPNREQIEAAWERLTKVADEDYRNGYTGDFGCTMILTFRTYAPMCWLRYFFPEDAAE